MCLVVFIQECDQVHVEDVASDDNGQELRCVHSLLYDDYLITHTLALLQLSAYDRDVGLFPSSKYINKKYFSLF